MDLQRRQPAGELSALVGPAAAERRPRDAGAPLPAHRSRGADALAGRLPRRTRGLRRRRQRRAGGDGRAAVRVPRAPRHAGAVARRGLDAHGDRDVRHAAGRAVGVREHARRDAATAARAAVRVPGRTRQRLGESDRRRAVSRCRRFPGPRSSRFAAAACTSALRPSVPGKTSSRRPDPRPGDSLPWWARLPRDEEATLGSNNWAVSGARSRTGSAIVANDMHLRLAVPNIWFRAAFEYPRRATRRARRGASSA